MTKCRFNEVEEIKYESGGELLFHNDFVQIREIDGLSQNNTPQLRFYRSSPNGFTLQLRTYDGIGAKLTSKAKPRNMMANISIGVDELEKMLEYAKKQIGGQTRNLATARSVGKAGSDEGQIKQEGIK